MFINSIVHFICFNTLHESSRLKQKVKGLFKDTCASPHTNAYEIFIMHSDNIYKLAQTFKGMSAKYFFFELFFETLFFSSVLLWIRKKSHR